MDAPRRADAGKREAEVTHADALRPEGAVTPADAVRRVAKGAAPWTRAAAVPVAAADSNYAAFCVAWFALVCATAIASGLSAYDSDSRNRTIAGVTVTPNGSPENTCDAVAPSRLIVKPA